ncbi:acyl-CoA dehydrogenase family protein [Lacinutrix neustonica]|uniref:Acyl-CoA dehydrogenase family protein n=1 Tax=Lacinutrix neustonica TaxID=2980107 RepID=A0A9E8MW95_9FLAO|nr:acyl-CoA dehydrogenase family protein [Lacinutrix neustonica]WAC02516.1 acyl-CoA dehydrogenase family protein [Lacinutrix neustonica]
MYIKIFALEALVYRTANAIDLLRHDKVAQGRPYMRSKTEALKDFSIECAIAKVYGSEVQDYIVDEGLQVYGGMGYSTEAPMERLYRSVRISRIFEGTNEINRLLIVKEFLKKGLKGELDLFTPLTACLDWLEKNEGGDYGSSPWSELLTIVAHLKSLTLVVAGVTAQKFLQELEEEQEIVTHIANLLIEIYALESAVLRVRKLKNDPNLEAKAIHMDVLHALAFETSSRMEASVKALMFSFDDPEDAVQIKNALAAYSTVPHRNIKKHKRAVANYFIAETRYTLG